MPQVDASLKHDWWVAEVYVRWGHRQDWWRRHESGVFGSRLSPDCCVRRRWILAAVCTRPLALCLQSSDHPPPSSWSSHFLYMHPQDCILKLNPIQKKCWLDWINLCGHRTPCLRGAWLGEAWNWGAGWRSGADRSPWYGRLRSRRTRWRWAWSGGPSTPNRRSPVALQQLLPWLCTAECIASALREFLSSTFFCKQPADGVVSVFERRGGETWLLAWTRGLKICYVSTFTLTCTKFMVIISNI